MLCALWRFTVPYRRTPQSENITSLLVGELNHYREPDSWQVSWVEAIALVTVTSNTLSRSDNNALFI